jgi:hypothetical protein
MTDQPQKQEGVGFFGIHFAYPRTFWGVLPFVLVCAIIAYVAHLLLGGPSRPQASAHLWTPLVILTNGNENVIPESRRMEFWTPSSKTKDYLARNKGEFYDSDKWQILSNDDPVLQFGNTLHASPGVTGYRRTEVWGHGRSGFKPGWWWTMTVATNYSVDRFASNYQAFWKSPHAVFVELIDNGQEQ